MCCCCFRFGRKRSCIAGFLWHAICSLTVGVLQYVGEYRKTKRKLGNVRVTPVMTVFLRQIP